MTTKTFSHKNVRSIPVVWKVVMMITYIYYGGYVYLVKRITDLIDSVAAQ